MMSDFDHAFARHISSAQYVFQERHNVIHPLRSAERDEKKCIVISVLPFSAHCDLNPPTCYWERGRLTGSADVLVRTERSEYALCDFVAFADEDVRIRGRGRPRSQ